MKKNVVEKKVTIDLVENPIEIKYEEVPEFTKEDYEERIGKAFSMAQEKGFSHLIVYGDREHFSNIHYLTGLDPRFEEALLILQKDKKPIIVVGNECLDYSHKIEFDIERILYPPFSLMGQPPNNTVFLEDIFKNAGINDSSLVGVCGWKYYDDSEHTLSGSILDVPHYIIETLCNITKRENLVNAVDIFAHNDYGLRTNMSAKEIINYELNATKASRNVYNVFKNLKEGITEIEASSFLNLDGEPTAAHANTSFGEKNTSYGIASPSYHRRLKLGDPIGVGTTFRGGSIHKAGVYINSPEDLTKEERNVREHFYHTYFKSVVNFYENFKIGNTCGEIYDIVDTTLGEGQPGGIKKFNIGLNPGHLIHTEEWINAPFNKDSKTTIRSGMGVQCDYTVKHLDPYLTAHIEDGFAVADEELRNEIKQLSPSCYERMEARRNFLKDVIGIDVPEEVMPFSDLQAVCFPYMADINTILCIEE